MSIDIERAAFEAWFSDDGKFPKAVERAGDGYILMQAQQAWTVWQAARATPQAPTHAAAVHQVKHHGDGKEWTDVGPDRFGKFAEAGFDTRVLYAAPLPRQAAVQTQPRHIPDSECVQSKCANCTTGCWDVCSMRNPGYVIATMATTPDQAKSAPATTKKEKS